MFVSKQLQSDLSGDEIIRENQASGDGAEPQEKSKSTHSTKSYEKIDPTESLCDLGNRKKSAPRDAGHI